VHTQVEDQATKTGENQKTLKCYSQLGDKFGTRVQPLSKPVTPSQTGGRTAPRRVTTCSVCRQHTKRSKKCPAIRVVTRTQSQRGIPAPSTRTTKF